MNLFEQYGIKEVADVTLYSIHKKQDGSGDLYYMPAIYFDTLKVSTVEKTGESTWAEGGIGNAQLVNWDYNKRIKVTLEDALCTPASLGLCWDGILSANWKDAKVSFNTEACNCQNPLRKISRMEKAFYPRETRGEVTISNLLPQTKDDSMSNYLGMLGISSVVDGTDIRGFGTVRNQTYRWKMAIESAVKSIAVVPDRFFDVKGKAYPIDWDRKVSVNSLPTYENYKDTIIYKINSKGKCHIPPIAKIIFDEAMANMGEVVSLTLHAARPTYKEVEGEQVIDLPLSSQITLAELFTQSGFKLYEEGIVSKTVNDEEVYYIPFQSLDSKISYTTHTPSSAGIEESYSFDREERLFQINDESLLPNCLIEVTADIYDNVLVNYLQNRAATDLIEYDQYGSVRLSDTTIAIKEGDYLAIIVDNRDNYIPLIGKLVDKVSPVTSLDDEDTNAHTKTVVWYKPAVDIDVTQFKGIDMWLRFESINEMIYFLITKYENDILSIVPSTIRALNNGDKKTWSVDQNKTTVSRNEDEEADRTQGKLWAYVNPHTMTPYADDYWFSENEAYYVKSLTLAPQGKKLKGNRIIVKADQWPGMYMLVGETWIRHRDTGEDERLQVRIPSCKVKADQTLTLEAAGDPVVFTMELEVAQPRNGKMMEVNTFEIAPKMVEGENGCYYAVDGSSEVLSE